MRHVGQDASHVFRGQLAVALDPGLKLFEDLRGPGDRVVLALDVDCAVAGRDPHAQGVADSSHVLVTAPNRASSVLELTTEMVVSFINTAPSRSRARVT